MKTVPDYSLYLVTDSSDAILGSSKSITSVVEAAVLGGVTVVQYRDKSLDTGTLISVAEKLHQVTSSHGVPLIINDRLDVALAVGAEGVHIGQDDISVASARKILGKDAIVGVTASSPHEALAACKGGADYLGIGTVYATPTKPDSKTIIGPSGVRDILAALEQNNYKTPTVCIGSINAQNATRVLYQSVSGPRSLSGIAVVSAIVAAHNPREASRALLSQVQSHHKSHASIQAHPQASHILTTSQSIHSTASSILQRLASTKPLNHNMTNLVVQNFAANIAIAIGSSPIMSNNGAEASDLAALNGALVINMGTVTADGLKSYVQALHAYNAAGNPVLFDPVGGGATGARREAVTTLMHEGYFSVIKGNEAEVRTVAGAHVAQRGVDGGSESGTDGTDTDADADKAKIELVRSLAARERNVVLMTGKTDYLSDGLRTLRVRNGHAYLGEITGSGCALGSTIAACLAVEGQDTLAACLAGLLMYEVGAERASAREDVKGPGTFVPAFIDELYKMRTAIHEDDSWLQHVKVDMIE